MKTIIERLDEGVHTDIALRRGIDDICLCTYIVSSGILLPVIVIGLTTIFIRLKSSSQITRTTIIGFVVDIEAVEVVLLDGITDSISISLDTFEEVATTLLRDPIVRSGLTLRSKLVTDIRNNPAKEDLTTLDVLEELEVSLLILGQLAMRTPERYDVDAIGKHTEVLLWIRTLSRPATEPAEATYVRRLLPSTELAVILLLLGGELIGTRQLNEGNGSLEILLIVEGQALIISPLATSDRGEGHSCDKRIFKHLHR